jgi:hypothetical protein
VRRARVGPSPCKSGSNAAPSRFVAVNSVRAWKCMGGRGFAGEWALQRMPSLPWQVCGEASGGGEGAHPPSAAQAACLASEAGGGCNGEGFRGLSAEMWRCCERDLLKVFCGGRDPFSWGRHRHAGGRPAGRFAWPVRRRYCDAPRRRAALSYTRSCARSSRAVCVGGM